MHSGGRDSRIARNRAQPVDAAPWAVALNETAASDDIPGPWVFAFRVPDRSEFDGHPRPGSQVRGA